MINHKKSIAKLFGPVLLLTGALALPADIAAANSAKPVISRPDKDHNKQGKGKQAARAQVNQANRQARAKAEKQQIVQQKQVVHQRQVRQKQIQKQQVRQEAQLQKQAQLDRQIRLQRQAQRQQQLNIQRQQQLNIQRQRQAQLDRQIQLQRQAARQRTVIVNRPRTRFVARPYAYRTSPYYRNGSYYVPAVPQGYRDRSVVAADGYLEGGGDCLILRGHQGQVYSLVGNNGGLREGDHVRLLGRLTYDNYCGATALDVTEVQAVWADRNHRQVYFDHLTDGSFDRYAGRYEDDRYYDDRYDDRYNGDYDRYEP